MTSPFRCCRSQRTLRSENNHAAPMSFDRGGLWSPGDIRDKSLEFPLFDLNFDGQTDTAACSETIEHSSQSVSGKGFPRGCVAVSSQGHRGWVRGKGPPRGCGSYRLVFGHWSSVSLGFGPRLRYGGLFWRRFLPWLGVTRASDPAVSLWSQVFLLFQFRGVNRHLNDKLHCAGKKIT